MKSDEIKEIPTGLVNYLGEGKMVLPSIETIQNELLDLPNDNLISLPILRKRIANKFEVTTTCPKTTLSTIRNMMDQTDHPSWRVVNGKGELISKDPETQAQLLTQSGFTIDKAGKKWKVENFTQFISK